VVTVAGQPITQQEWDSAQREQMARLAQVYGTQFDPKLFDTPTVKQEVLDNLISQRTLAVEASRQRLMIPDQILQRAILETPGLLTPDGKFDGARYKQLLSLQGMTPEMYEAKLRQDLALQQLNASIQGTAFAPRTVTTRLSDMNSQERVVGQFTIQASDYAAKVKITDQMLKDYYDKNIQQFTIPEHANIQYLVLDAKVLAGQINVSDDDIKSYYAQNASHYTTEEERRASHILIAVNKDAPAAEQAKAKAKAETLLAEVRKDPSSFARVAKENSQDPGSATKGGDLGFFTKQAMVKPFADAAFGLKQGQISDLVKSDFGYHIIQLTAIKPAVAKPLAEVKDTIKADIQKQLVSKKFAELADVFNNVAYEQGDSLKPAADQLKLTIQTASDVTRNPNPALAPTVPYNKAAFLKALFTDDVVHDKHNSAVVEIGPNTLISGRITQHVAASKRPFANVETEVRRDVMQLETARLAREAGEARLTALRAKDDAAIFSASKTVSRTQPAGFSNSVLAAIMKADVRSLPAFVGVPVAESGYTIFRISKVMQPEKQDVARRKAESEQIANVLAQQEMVDYLDVLKKKAKVEFIKKPAAAGDAQETTSPAAD
ncbi:MAG: SurA N-terminal domain-containing protein, partial [Herbaspirillum sp.]